MVWRWFGVGLWNDKDSCMHGCELLQYQTVFNTGYNSLFQPCIFLE